MQDPVGMEEVEAPQKLLHVALGVFVANGLDQAAVLYHLCIRMNGLRKEEEERE